MAGLFAYASSSGARCELGERRVHHRAQLGGVGHIQRTDPQPVAVGGGQIRQLLRLAQRRRDAVTPREQLLGQLPAEAARGASNEPGGGHDDSIPRPALLPVSIPELT
jgi:hypothetical protein